MSDNILEYRSLIDRIELLIHKFIVITGYKPSTIYVGIDEYKTLNLAYAHISDSSKLGRESVSGIPLIKVSKNNHLAIGYDE